MRLPRDVSGIRLIKGLRSLDYEISRQSGSHTRVTTATKGTHHVTVPKHDPLKLGTFASILDDVAGHHGLERADLLRILDL